MKNASEARQRTEWERKIRRWQKSKGITVRGQEKVVKIIRPDCTLAGGLRVGCLKQ